MPAPVKGATKKAPAAKKAAASAPARRGRQSTTESLGPRVVKMRDSGKKWSEISEELGISVGRCADLYNRLNVPSGQAIKFTSDDDLARKVRDARDKQNLSWGNIAQRAGVPEGRVRRLYEQLTGTPARGLRIGKGGRYPSDGERPVRAAKAPAKKATAKKAAGPVAKRATATGTALSDMTLAELKARLNDKTITVTKATGQGREKIKVKSVKSIKNGELTFVDGDGKTRTFVTTYIVSATK